MEWSAMGYRPADDLLCFADVQDEVISPAAVHKLFHLLSVGLIIISPGQAHNRRVIRILD